jgi:hypothetical protein
MPGSDDYDYDPEDHVYSLEDVCDRLDSIEEAVKYNHSSVIEWAFAALGVLVVIVWIPDMWHSKLRYAYQYDLTVGQVTIEKEPADCNFFHAPLGGKGCHYDRQATVIRARTDGQDPNKHYVSFDDGKTWIDDYASPPTQPQVIVSWQRVED